MTAGKGSELKAKPVLEKQFESLVRAATDAIIGIDHQGKITTWNAAATRMFGYSAKQAAGKSLHDLLVPERQITEAKKGFDGFVKTGKGPLVGKVTECTAMRKDGSEFPIELSISGFKQDGHWHATGIIRDISGRKRLEQALQTREKQLSTTLQSIGDAVISTDMQGRVELMNPVAEQLTGWKSNEACGQPLEAVFHIINEESRNPVENPVSRVLRDGIVIGLANHTLLIAKNGSEIPVADSGAPIRDSRGRICGVVLVFRDQTAERKAQAAVQEARLIAESIVSTVREPLLVLDAGLHVVSTNRAFYRTFQVSEKEMEGQRLYDLGNGEWDIPALRKLLEDILPQNTFFDDYEVEHDFSSIGRRTMRLNARRIHRDANKTQLILLAIEDITGRKQAEEKFKAVFQNANDPIFIHDLDGNIVDINEKALETFGYSQSEMQALKISDLHPAGSLPESRRAFETISKEGTAFFEIDFRVKNGDVFSAEVSSKTFEIGGKKYIQGSVRDITKRKKAEKALQQQEQRARQVIDTARDAFVSMDADGIITDWNPQAEETFGWSREEALGRMVAEIIIPEELRGAHKKGMKHYLATGEGPVLNQKIEITALHRDGHTIPVELSIVAVRTDDTINFNAFIRDISGQVQTREALEKSREQLRASLIGTIIAVSRAVGARDPYTAGHQQRVSRLSRAIAQEMGLDKERIDGLRMGASIHDIGKIYLPAEILSKPAKLTEIEYELVQSHAQVGYDILKDVAFPWPVADIAHQHHERLDGSGYPQGLKGDEICLEAKIVGVADVVEAMASHRPYRPALGIEAALEEIKSKRGQFYDSGVVDACLTLFREKKFSFEDK